MVNVPPPSQEVHLFLFWQLLLFVWAYKTRQTNLLLPPGNGQWPWFQSISFMRSILFLFFVEVFLLSFIFYFSIQIGLKRVRFCSKFQHLRFPLLTASYSTSKVSCAKAILASDSGDGLIVFISWRNRSIIFFSTNDKFLSLGIPEEALIKGSSWKLEFATCRHFIVCGALSLSPSSPYPVANCWLTAPVSAR